MRLLPALALLLVLPATYACTSADTQTPAPSSTGGSGSAAATPTPPPPADTQTPALTAAEVTSALGHIADVESRAAAKRDLKLAATVLAGEALDYARAEFAREKKFRLKPEGSSPKSTFESVWSQPADHYPQTALVVSKYVDQESADYRLLSWLVRSEPGAPWRRADGTYIEAKQLPKIARTASGVTPAVSPSESVNGVAPDQLSSLLVSVMRDPSAESAQRFTGDPQAKYYRTATQDVRQYAKGSGFRYSARDRSAAVPTADGGLLIITSIDVAKTSNPRQGTVIAFTKKAYQRSRYPGSYQRLTEEFRDGFVVYVPPKGKVLIRTHSVTEIDSPAS